MRRVGGRQAVGARRHGVLGQDALRVRHQVQACKDIYLVSKGPYLYDVRTGRVGGGSQRADKRENIG